MRDGGPAFPVGESYTSTMLDGTIIKHQKDALFKGMTLRDYFAAAAITGLTANSFSDGTCKPLSNATPLEMAEMAYKQADEMLKWRAA